MHPTLRTLETIRDEHGLASAAELAFLKQQGEAHLAQPGRLPHATADVQAEILASYHAQLQTMTPDRQFEHHHAVVGWLGKTSYSDPKLHELRRSQQYILRDVAMLLYTPDSDWTQTDRATRIAELNMAARATEKIMLRGKIVRDVPYAYRKLLREAIVTDDPNPNYRPDRNMIENHDNQASYDLTRRQIHFGMYSNYDATQNRAQAYESLDHEMGHRLSDLWRHHFKHSETDIRIFNYSFDLMKIFRTNFQNDPSDLNARAYVQVYHATPDEDFVRGTPVRYDIKHPTIPVQNAAFYREMLRNDHEFQPISQRADATLAQQQTAKRHWTSNVSCTYPSAIRYVTDITKPDRPSSASTTAANPITECKKPGL